MLSLRPGLRPVLRISIRIITTDSLIRAGTRIGRGPPDIERILSDQVTRMLCLDLVGVMLTLRFRPLQSGDLGLGEDNPIPRRPLLEDLESLLKGLEAVTNPDATDACSRDCDRSPAQLIGSTDLPIGGIFLGHTDHGVLDIFWDPVPWIRLAPTLLLQCLESSLFENTLPLYSYLSRSVRDSDILSPLSRLLRSSIPTNELEIIDRFQVTNLTK